MAAWSPGIELNLELNTEERSMKHILASVAATTLLAVTAIAGPASAQDVQLLEGVTARAGDNPLSEAGKYKKDCPWVIGMSHFGVNANTWTVQVAHESEAAAKKNSASRSSPARCRFDQKSCCRHRGSIARKSTHHRQP